VKDRGCVGLPTRAAGDEFTGRVAGPSAFCSTLTPNVYWSRSCYLTNFNLMSGGGRSFVLPCHDGGDLEACAMWKANRRRNPQLSTPPAIAEPRASYAQQRGGP